MDIESYCKLVLHCAKYPTESCGGFLIGGRSGSEFVVSDVVPVFHGPPLLPLLELASMLSVEGSSEKIIGIYFANEIASDKSKPVYIEKIIKSIRDEAGVHASPICLSE